MAARRFAPHRDLTLLPKNRQLWTNRRAVRQLRGDHQKTLPGPGEQRGHEEVLQATPDEEAEVTTKVISWNLGFLRARSRM